MKNHIFSIILAAVCCAFVACNQNTPDDTKKGGDTPTSQHQPSDPASWSPNGKTYVCSSSDYNPADYALFINSIEFIKDNEVRIKGTTYTEVPIPSQGEFSTATNYICEYPNVKINGNDADGYTFVFVDTLTMRSIAWGKVYHLQY